MVTAERQHLPLLLPVDQIVEILHRDELGQAHLLRRRQIFGELPGMHGGGADIPGLARLHHVMQRLDGFLDGGGMVEAVDLVEIDILHAQPAQGIVDRMHDVLAR